MKEKSTFKAQCLTFNNNNRKVNHGKITFHFWLAFAYVSKNVN